MNFSNSNFCTIRCILTVFFTQNKSELIPAFINIRSVGHNVSCFVGGTFSVFIPFEKWSVLPLFKISSLFEYYVFYPAVFAPEKLQCGSIVLFWHFDLPSQNRLFLTILLTILVLQYGHFYKILSIFVNNCVFSSPILHSKTLTWF